MPIWAARCIVKLLIKKSVSAGLKAQETPKNGTPLGGFEHHKSGRFLSVL
jgi:hypothetical protein